MLDQSFLVTVVDTVATLVAAVLAYIVFVSRPLADGSYRDGRSAVDLVEFDDSPYRAEWTQKERDAGFRVVRGAECSTPKVDTVRVEWSGGNRVRTFKVAKNSDAAVTAFMLARK